MKRGDSGQFTMVTVQALKKCYVLEHAQKKSVSDRIELEKSETARRQPQNRISPYRNEKKEKGEKLAVSIAVCCGSKGKRKKEENRKEEKINKYKL